MVTLLYPVSATELSQHTFGTVFEALTKLTCLRSSDSSQAGLPATIQIGPGIYREKLEIRESNLILRGTGDDPSATVLVYGDGAFAEMPDGLKRGTFRTYSVFVDACNVTLQNLTISNDSGDENKVGQAIALYADGDHLLIEDCRLLGRQDTLFTGPLPPKELQPNGFIGPKQFDPRLGGRQLYRRCYICGNVDFIFGSATAYFEDCTIESLLHTDPVDKEGKTAIQGYVTAPSTPEGQRCGYCFRGCKFISRECPDGSVYLGRPWRDYASAVFVDCEIGKHIHSAGFHDWNKPNARANSRFGVINCSNPDGSAFLPAADFMRLGDLTGEDFTPEQFLSETPAGR